MEICKCNTDYNKYVQGRGASNPVNALSLHPNRTVCDARLFNMVRPHTQACTDMGVRVRVRVRGIATNQLASRGHLSTLFTRSERAVQHHNSPCDPELPAKYGLVVLGERRSCAALNCGHSHSSATGWNATVNRSERVRAARSTWPAIHGSASGHCTALDISIICGKKPLHHRTQSNAKNGSNLSRDTAACDCGK